MTYRPHTDFELYYEVNIETLRTRSCGCINCHSRLGRTNPIREDIAARLDTDYRPDAAQNRPSDHGTGSDYPFENDS